MKIRVTEFREHLNLLPTDDLMLFQVIDVHSVRNITEHVGYSIHHKNLQIGAWITQKSDRLQLRPKTLLKFDSLIDVYH